MKAHDSKQNPFAILPFARNFIDKLFIFPRPNDLKSISTMQSHVYCTTKMLDSNHIMSKKDICSTVDVGTYDECDNKSFKSLDSTYETIEDVVPTERSTNENDLV